MRVRHRNALGHSERRPGDTAVVNAGMMDQRTTSRPGLRRTWQGRHKTRNRHDYSKKTASKAAGQTGPADTPSDTHPVTPKDALTPTIGSPRITLASGGYRPANGRGTCR